MEVLFYLSSLASVGFQNHQIMEGEEVTCCSRESDTTLAPPAGLENVIPGMPDTAVPLPLYIPFNFYTHPLISHFSLPYFPFSAVHSLTRPSLPSLTSRLPVTKGSPLLCSGCLPP